MKMCKARFRCRLLSDVILQGQSTVGQLQRSIDFIPGNTFLGIMARKYDSYSMEQQMDLFHNGTVRYGDAHPIGRGGSIRSLRIPASLYYPKLKGMEGGLYIHHIYNRSMDKEDDGRPQQLKQCRNGFYVFDMLFLALLLNKHLATADDVQSSCGICCAHTAEGVDVHHLALTGTVGNKLVTDGRSAVVV